MCKTFSCDLNPLQGFHLVEALANEDIIQISAHPDGKHYLALTADGEVYAWGNGEGGRLGLGNTRYMFG